MIKADKDGVSIEYCGSLPDFLTEVTMMNRAIRKSLSKRIGEEIADELLEQSHRLSKMNEEELEKESEEIKEKVVSGFLFGGTDSPGSVEEDK